MIGAKRMNKELDRKYTMRGMLKVGVPVAAVALLMNAYHDNDGDAGRTAEEAGYEIGEHGTEAVVNGGRGAVAVAGGAVRLIEGVVNGAGDADTNLDLSVPHVNLPGGPEVQAGEGWYSFLDRTTSMSGSDINACIAAKGLADVVIHPGQAPGNPC